MRNVYRHIVVGTAWIALVVSSISLGVHADEPTGESLFNGKDLSGWKGVDGHWSVEDGAIVGKTTAEKPLKNNTFLIFQGKPLKDFSLTLNYKIEGGNSGIQYRSRVIDAEKFIIGGYQADIDIGLKFTGICYDERGRGILVQRGQKVAIGADGKKQVTQFAKADDLKKYVHNKEWNHYKIVAKETRLQHFINDVLMSEVNDAQTGKSVREGVLALQLHQGPPMVIRFKNIRCERF